MAATIGARAAGARGYVDPAHKQPDRHPNFGEGKQRWMCKVQDVPYLVKWMKENGVSGRGAEAGLHLLHAGVHDAGWNARGLQGPGQGRWGGADVLAESPDHWCTPDNTLSRNCAGCHVTGVKITTKDFLNDPNPAHKLGSVVVAWDYKDLNISCERCHGPGSEHAASSDKAKIIAPQHLTAKAGNETCGQCHGNHDGRSQRLLLACSNPPSTGPTRTPSATASSCRACDLATFFASYEQPTTGLNPDWKEGPMSWPDQIHARSHSMELSELRRSAHFNNRTQRLTCFSCHDAHSMDGGPASLKAGGYDFTNAAYCNNAVPYLPCLPQVPSPGSPPSMALQVGRGARSPGRGPVAVKRMEAGRRGTRSPGAWPTHAGRGRHGQRPSTRHRSQDARGQLHVLPHAEDRQLQDINVGLDTTSTSTRKAAAPWPKECALPRLRHRLAAQSSVLRTRIPQGKDFDIMPNSCSRCHAFARTSGDAK
ncbi:MAG: hypothetical protein IPP58_13705 [Holophagaceae bacterium]|uniref:Cytochrome c-552/4 domain-containing protein n=1 Tax=Candidatus Geothrix skivensis TaxID=2954439 RepID=A0A9D7XIQ6_9BACT|nr:hypothetical protein [Candidatus Geothrix skivensis]